MCEGKAGPPAWDLIRVSGLRAKAMLAASAVKRVSGCVNGNIAGIRHEALVKPSRGGRPADGHSSLDDARVWANPMRPDRKPARHVVS